MSTFKEVRMTNVNEIPEPWAFKAKHCEAIIKIGMNEYDLEMWQVLAYLDVHWSEYQFDLYYDRPFLHKVIEDFKLMQESKNKN